MCKLIYIYYISNEKNFIINYSIMFIIKNSFSYKCTLFKKYISV